MTKRRTIKEAIEDELVAPEYWRYHNPRIEPPAPSIEHAHRKIFKWATRMPDKYGRKVLRKLYTCPTCGLTSTDRKRLEE